MNRRRFLLTALAGALAAPLTAAAQQPSKVYRLAFLWANTSLPPAAPPPPGTLGALLNAFLQRLQELGWIEGQNLAIEHRFAEGQFERLPALAADLVGRKVDVIVATSGIAALAAKQATATIPIIFTGAADALAMGLVASLAQPGGNVTGLTWLSMELSGKRLELLKEALPSVSRVAVLRCPRVAGQPNLADGPQWRETQVVARTLGVHLHSLEVQGPDDLESAWEAVTNAHDEALLPLDCPPLNVPPGLQQVIAFTAKSRLPGMHLSRGHAIIGGLMAYGPNPADAWRRAATLVDKVLKGAKPADLPVEQVVKFDLVINLKTAKALGITIPPTLLFQATEVIRED